MNQTVKQLVTPQSTAFAITPMGAPIKISSRRGIWTVILFCAIVIGAVIGTGTVPASLVENLLNGKGSMTWYVELSVEELADLVGYVTGGFAG